VSLGTANSSFKLSADSGKTFKKFESVGTFCTQNTDCKGQSYAHIMCVGYASCNADTQKCGWKCGTEPTKCDYTATPTKSYIGKSPESCMLIRFACAEGFSYFSDSCGCGCEKTGVSTLPACKPGGCSGQVCTDKEGLMTTCEWRESYACYQKLGVCERGADGACGWRSTNELEACLEASL
jgi:eight-cysteine-cluster-containing protein